jgi:hypothetical protein
MQKILTTIVIVVGLARPAVAQTGSDANRDALRRAWERISRDVSAEMRVSLAPRAQDGATLSPETGRAYDEIVRRLLVDPSLGAFFKVDRSLVDQTVRLSDRALVDSLKTDKAAEAKVATSLNASATNPSGGGTTERSGFTDFVALAADLKNVISSNDTAITVNLNALALYGLKDPEVYSALAIYRQHDLLRRLSGTVTFGAKVPESDITGITGLPDSDKLLDVFVWNAKLRIYGDRDPRAQRWYDDTLGSLAGINEIAASLPGLVPLADAGIVTGVFADKQGLALARFRDRLKRSAQVTIESSGQHLTKESGRNKYTFGVLADKGFGDTDLSVNVLYSTTDALATDAVTVFHARNLASSIALVKAVGQNAIVKDRAVTLALSANLDVPIQKEGPRSELKSVWRAVGSITLPWGDVATIPISVSVVSDPNNLAKQNYVVGHVGVAYDFGALKSLFK